MEKISPIGREFRELETELLTPEEIAEIDAKVALIGEIIRERQEIDASHQQIEE